jgi:hypothetical protein
MWILRRASAFLRRMLALGSVASAVASRHRATILRDRSTCATAGGRATTMRTRRRGQRHAQADRFHWDRTSNDGACSIGLGHFAA